MTLKVVGDKRVYQYRHTKVAGLAGEKHLECDKQVVGGMRCVPPAMEYPEEDNLIILLPLCQEHLARCKEDYILATGSSVSFYNRGEEEK